jgi:hypothetical protein
MRKKANLYCAELTIHLQERLIQFASLSYNELVSATIDQERMIKVVAEVDEEKQKNMMPGSSCSGSSSSAPPMYRMVYTSLGATVVELGQSPTIPTVAISAATAAIAAAIVQPCSYPTATTGCRKMGHFTRECC